MSSKHRRKDDQQQPVDDPRLLRNHNNNRNNNTNKPNDEGVSEIEISAENIEEEEKEDNNAQPIQNNQNRSNHMNNNRNNTAAASASGQQKQGSRNHASKSKSTHNHKKKEITLIGAAALNLKQMVKNLDTQYDMTAGQKGIGRELVDLAKMNKYVGYKSDQLSVTIEEVKANVKMLVVTNNGKVPQFPNRELVIARYTGRFASIQDRMLTKEAENFEKTEMVAVRVVDLAESCQTGGGNYNDNNNTGRQNRFKQKDSNCGGEQIFQASAHQESQNLTNKFDRPTDFTHAFTVKTSRVDLVYYTKFREDRDILVHEFNNICQQTSIDIELLSARQDVMDKIDPIQSFNAWNLSVVCGPVPEEQAAFAMSKKQTKMDGVSEQAQIIKAEPGYVSYIRDGVRSYVSETLRKELYATDGDLYKESKTKMHALKGKYRKIFAAVDFKKHLIRFKENRDDDKFISGKNIAFQEILEIKRLDIDVFKGEHKKKLKLQFRSKFLLKTLNREHFLFAKNDIEREIWVESFMKILDINETGISHCNLKSTGNMYMRSIDRDTPVVQSMHREVISKKRLLATIDGVEIFKTEFLQVNKNAMKGTVMKAIENLSFFHKNPYHQRYFLLEFGQPYCYFYENKSKESFHKAHRQTFLRAARILEDAEITEKLMQREENRSKSFLRKYMKKEITRCNWNFPFTVTFEDKEYELYAPTRADREQWVHILSTIAEMNLEGIKLESMTPFDYLREKEASKQKQEEEAKMTESARAQAQGLEVEKQLFEQVHIWLRLNQDMMQQHRPKVKPYVSDCMKLQADCVRGVCYLITRKNSSMSGTQALSNVANGPLKMTKIELYLNIKIQTFLVQKVGVDGTSKYTFSEISMCDSSNFKIESKDFETNEADPRFKYCFRIQVKNNPLKVVACSSEEDRSQWLRSMQLLIQMKNLGIDSGKVNIFTFEQFRQYQLRVITRKYGLDEIDDEEPLRAPQSDLNYNSGDEEEKNESNSQQPHPLVQNQRSQNKMQANRANLIKAHNRTKSIDDIMQTIQTMESGTFGMSSRYIEGYLLKEIDSSNMLRRTKRHLRYFRIIYTSGKLNVKEDKSKNEMRSFLLKDLLSVLVLKRPSNGDDVWGYPKANKMMDVTGIRTSYKADYKSDQTSWPYQFRIEFSQRSFTLSAKTTHEFTEWMRVFNLIIQMNRIGFNVADKNPYVFEDQQSMTTLKPSYSMEDLANMQADMNEHISETQNFSHHESVDQVDFGVGSQEIGQNDPDIDNLNTASFAMDRNSLVFNSNVKNSLQNTQQLQGRGKTIKEPEQSFAAQMAENLKKLKEIGEAPYKLPKEGEQTDNSRFSMRNEPVKALPQQNAVVNQNITVQNITIQQMTMMPQNENGHNNKSGSKKKRQPHHQPAPQQTTQLFNPSQTIQDYASQPLQLQPSGQQNGFLGVNGVQNFQYQNRASSVDQVEVLADLTSIDDYNSRPKSQLGDHQNEKRARKKKKKKVRRAISDNHSQDQLFTAFKNGSQATLDMDASTIGGMPETESQMFLQEDSIGNGSYKQDAIQSFEDESLDYQQDQKQTKHNIKHDRFGSEDNRTGHSNKNNKLLQQQQDQQQMSNFMAHKQNHSMQILNPVPDSQDEIKVFEPLIGGAGGPLQQQNNRQSNRQSDRRQQQQKQAQMNFQDNGEGTQAVDYNMNSNLKLEEIDDFDYNHYKNYKQKNAVDSSKSKQDKAGASRRSSKRVNHRPTILDQYTQDEDLPPYQQNSYQNAAQVTKIEDFNAEQVISSNRNRSRRRDQHDSSFGEVTQYEGMGDIQRQQSPQAIAKRVQKRQHQKLDKEGDSSNVRISLSKVRLAGSKDVLGNLASVKKATGFSAFSEEDNHDLSMNQMQKNYGSSINRLTSEVDMNSNQKNSFIKSIAAANNFEDKATLGNYQTEGGLIGNSFASPAQIKIPLIATAKKKKKRKVLVIRKRDGGRASPASSAQNNNDIEQTDQRPEVHQQQHGEYGHHELSELEDIGVYPTSSASEQPAFFIDPKKHEKKAKQRLLSQTNKRNSNQQQSRQSAAARREEQPQRHQQQQVQQDLDAVSDWDDG